MRMWTGQVFIFSVIHFIIDGKIIESAGGYQEKEWRSLSSGAAEKTICGYQGGESDNLKKLSNLRQLMLKRNISAYVITSRDDHQTEFVAPPDRRLEFISGFTGSLGAAVITLGKAAIWVDFRYYLQADYEVDCSWILIKTGTNGVPSIQEWIAYELKSEGKVSADPKIIPYHDWLQWSGYLSSFGINMKPLYENLIDQIWENRPSYPNEPVVVHDLLFAGETWQSKLSRVRNMMSYHSADMCIISGLDEIAWVLNLRGNDIPNAPLFRSYLIIRSNSTTLYLPREKITLLVQTHLYSSKETISVIPYERMWYDLEQSGKLCKRIWIPSIVGSSIGSSYLIYQLVPKEKMFAAPSPIINLKAYKNDVEATGMVNAHVRDAVAICELWVMIEKELPAGVYWDELKVSSILKQLRSKQPLNRGESFQSIVSFGTNSALPHYIPSNKTSKRIDNSSLLMVDSGGQYLDGTIDTTRVFSFGQPTEFQRQVYTALLQGCINLVTTSFPLGTIMQNLDIIIRQPLYNLGYSYGHGSTHGVGSYLTVHEDFNYTYNVNFFGSQEPGCYLKGDFGIRLENVVQVVPQEVMANVKENFLTFKTVTLVPYEAKLINFKTLDLKQLNWLNAYNKRIRKLVGNEMLKQGKQDLFRWLVDKTDPICTNTI